MTRCQPVPSAKAPWTSTIVGFAVAGPVEGDAPLLRFAGAAGDWARSEPPATTARTRTVRKSRTKRLSFMAKYPFSYEREAGVSSGSVHRFKRRAEVAHEELRLLPRREVAALVVPGVKDELGIRLLRPALRRLIELLREGAHAGRDGDVLRCEEREMALPVETGRGDGRVREPVERDVVEDVVSRQSLGHSVEDADDERHAARVVVEHPGGQNDGRVP